MISSSVPGEIAADLRRRLHEAHHIHARLHHLIADDKADVSGAHHHGPLGRKDTVDIHQGLHRSRAVDSREVIVRKLQELFRRACGHNGLPRAEFQVPVLMEHGHNAVLVDTQHIGVRQELDIGIPLNLFHQELTDVNPAVPGILLLRTEVEVEIQTGLCGQQVAVFILFFKNGVLVGRDEHMTPTHADHTAYLKRTRLTEVTAEQVGQVHSTVQTYVQTTDSIVTCGVKEVSILVFTN